MRQVYDTYRDSLIAFAKGYVPDDDVAQDLVQEAFIRLWEKEPSFPTETALHSYLLTAVRNRALDYLKHRNVEQQYAETYREEAALAGEDYLDEAFDKEVLEMLFAQIDRLPARCREVFLLCLDGLSAEEVAQKLGISADTVRTQKKRAMKMLRNHFKNHPPKTNFCFFFIFFKLLYPV